MPWIWGEESTQKRGHKLLWTIFLHLCQAQKNKKPYGLKRKPQTKNYLQWVSSPSYKLVSYLVTRQKFLAVINKISGSHSEVSHSQFVITSINNTLKKVIASALNSERLANLPDYSFLRPLMNLFPDKGTWTFLDINCYIFTIPACLSPTSTAGSPKSQQFPLWMKVWQCWEVFRSEKCLFALSKSMMSLPKAFWLSLLPRAKGRTGYYPCPAFQPSPSQCCQLCSASAPDSYKKFSLRTKCCNFSHIQHPQDHPSELSWPCQTWHVQRAVVKSHG